MLIIAHRGASGYAPENTLAAFDLAIKKNCDVLEFDVHLTKDERLIICHDWTVDRTSNGKGAIKDLTLDEIKRLDAGSWFSKDFAAERMPTIEELFEFVPDTVILNIEIKMKPTDTRELEKKLVEILTNYDRLDSTLISSFNHLSLRRIKELDETIKTCVAIEADLIAPIEYLVKNNLNVYSYHPCKDYVSPNMLKQFHDHGIKVNCWTVNDKEQARELREMGVDGLITNFPDILGNT